MKNIKQKYYKLHQNGYAILFAVIIVSIISVITLGLSNTTYKQLVITSVAKDSQTAFYEADTASDCALYLDRQTTALSSGSFPIPWSCGVDSSGNSLTLTIDGSIVSNVYRIIPSNNGLTTPCFNIMVYKTNSPNTTTLISKGYNDCNQTDFRTVERAIQVSY